MPKLNLLCFFILCGSILSVGYGQAEEGTENLLQHAILVNVNSRKITRSDLDEMGLILFRLSYPDRPLDSITPQEVDLLSANALRELIIINLMEDELELRKNSTNPLDTIDISSSDINDHIKTLGLQKLSHKGYTRRFAKSQLVVNQALASTGKTFTPSPRAVLNFYRQHKDDVFITEREVKVGHIFLSNSSLNPETVKKQAGMLYAKLQKWDLKKRLRMFPQMAKEFSQGRFRKDGGVLMADNNSGWFPQEQDFRMPNGKTFFPEAMLKGIRKLSTPGQITLEKSESGWHILMLEGIRGGRPISFSKSRRFIGDYLQQNNMNKAKTDWLRSKIARSTILWNNGEAFDNSKLLSQPKEEDNLRYLSMTIRQAMERPRRTN